MFSPNKGKITEIIKVFFHDINNNYNINGIKHILMAQAFPLCSMKTNLHIFTDAEYIQHQLRYITI